MALTRKACAEERSAASARCHFGSLWGDTARTAGEWQGLGPKNSRRELAGRIRDLDIALPRRPSSSAPGPCLGTDLELGSIGSGFGGRDEWLIPHVLWGQPKGAHFRARRCQDPLHPAELLFMWTVGGARALNMEDLIGKFDAGREADFIVVDLPVGARLPRRWEGKQVPPTRNGLGSAG